MSDPSVAAALAECYQAECRSVVLHIAASQPFVSWLGVKEKDNIRRMVADEMRHQRQLAEAIVARSGGLPPISAATDAAAVHYLDVHYLMPLLLTDKRRIIAALESATPRLAADRDASALIGRILDDERRHLADLERIEAAASQPR